MKKVRAFGTITESGFKPDRGEDVELAKIKEGNIGKNAICDIKVEEDKSLDMLGWYFAGLLPAYVAHNKFNILQEAYDLNQLLLREMLKEKRITQAEVQAEHRTFMREFSPVVVTDLKTREANREGRSMHEMNNSDANMHISLVYEYLLNQCIPMTDIEKYKMEKKKAEGILKELEYPTENNDPDKITFDLEN